MGGCGDEEHQVTARAVPGDELQRLGVHARAEHAGDGPVRDPAEPGGIHATDGGADAVHRLLDLRLVEATGAELQAPDGGSEQGPPREQAGAAERPHQGDDRGAPHQGPIDVEEGRDAPGSGFRDYHACPCNHE